MDSSLDVTVGVVERAPLVVDTPPALAPRADFNEAADGGWVDDAAGWLTKARAALASGDGGGLDEVEALIRQGEGIGAKGARVASAARACSCRSPESPLYDGEGEVEREDDKGMGVAMQKGATKGATADDEGVARM